MKIILMDIDKLSNHPRNSKLHPKEQIDKIATSILKFGFNNPILISSDNTILAGHGRYQAARQIQMDQVPTICLDHLDPIEARAYIIADNKVSESGYDTEILCDELFDLGQAGIDGLSLGFDDIEIEKLMNASTAADEELEENDVVRGNIDVAPGQTWLVGEHKIHVGNRRLNLRRLYKLIKDSPKPMTVFLVERQAQNIVSRFEKDGEKITKDLGLLND